MSKNHKPLRIIGAPIDLGVSKLGVDMGPTALRYAGIFEAFEYAGFKYNDAGDLNVLRNFSLDHLPPDIRQNHRLNEIIRVSNELAQFVYDTYSNNEMPIILGGDHSTSIGTIAGIAKASKRLGLLWIDAHPDANTPETSPSGNIHGMTVAISLGYGYDQLVNCFDFFPKLRPEDVCIVGAKDIDQEEKHFLEKNGVSFFSTFDIENIGISGVMKQAAEIVTKNTDAVYVSFDVDVMDMQLAPGTGIMTKGGLSYREICYIMEYIGNNIELSALDVIEVNPLLDVKNKTAELCVELVMSLLGVRYSDYEKKYLRENRPG